MKTQSTIRFRSTALIAVSFLLAAAFASPAAAQAPDAADRCTPDVMRLCSEFVPDADRIVACLKVKRKQLTPDCLQALTSGKGRKKLRGAT